MSLRDTLAQIREQEDRPPVNWERNKTRWLASVKALYKDVAEDWLSDLIQDQLLSVEYREISISEEGIGNYRLNRMQLCSPKNCAVFEPIGQNIIGGEGRIDFFLSGEYGNGKMLILQRGEDQDRWIMVDKQGKQEREPFTKESLERTLEEWLQN